MRVFIVAAASADGFLARSSDDFSMDWTSPEDVKLFVKLTKEAGVMVMGSKTFATTIKAGRRLPGRKIVVYSSKPSLVQHSRVDPTEITSDSPTKVLRRLADEGYKAVAICGGASVYSLFLQAGVVDELYLTIEPVLFGKGIGLLSESATLKLKLLDRKLLNENTILLHYEVKK